MYRFWCSSTQEKAVVRHRVVLAVCGLVLLLSLSATVGRTILLRSDPTNSILLTSATQLQYPVVCSTFFRDLSTPLYVDTLPAVSGSNYSYRKIRQFDSVGTWHFKFQYRDSLTGVEYTQWASDACFYDTTSMQGAASGLTAAGIWSYATRTVTGWGGAGNYEVTLVILDAADSTAIQGVVVDVYDTTTSNPAHRCGSKATDNLGMAVCNLDATKYDVRTDHNNYVDAITEITVPASDFQDTIFLTQFSPGAPAAANLVRVWGYVYDISDNPVIGAVVRFELRGKRKVWRGNTVISPYWRQDTTDANGYWNLDVYANDSWGATANDSLYPAGTFYYGEISDTAGVVHEYDFTIPGDSAGGSWEFTPTR